MAVQILRPIASFGSSDTIMFTPTPSDTALEDVYMLVNEEEADDDATCVSINNSENKLYFDFGEISIPNITAIRCVIKWKCSANGLVAHAFDIGTYTDGTFTSLDSFSGATDATAYVVDTFECANSVGATRLVLQCYTNNSKSSTIITQVYLEVETNEISLKYKMDDVWNEITGEIYIKEAGVWNSTNLDVFSSDRPYITKYLT